MITTNRKAYVNHGVAYLRLMEALMKTSVVHKHLYRHVVGDSLSASCSITGWMGFVCYLDVIGSRLRE